MEISNAPRPLLEEQVGVDAQLGLSGGSLVLLVCIVSSLERAFVLYVLVLYTNSVTVRYLPKAISLPLLCLSAAYPLPTRCLLPLYSLLLTASPQYRICYDSRPGH